MSANFPSNVSLSFNFSSNEKDTSQLANAFAYITLFVVGIFGNSFIIHCVLTDKRLKSTTNLLIANMAVSDLISTFLLAPIKVWEFVNHSNNWPFQGLLGQVTCKVMNFLPDVSTAVSFYSCLFISVDRYLAVTYPLRGGFRRSQLKYILLTLWIVSALAVSPYLYYFRLANFLGSTRCMAKKNFISEIYHYVLLVLNLGIPLPIIAILYAIIVYNLFRHKAPGNQTDIERKRREQQNRKVLKLSIIIVSLLYLSWGFFLIVMFLVSERKITQTVMEQLYFWVFFIPHSSFAFNFFISLIFNDIYRDIFKSMILKLCCKFRLSRVARHTITGIDNKGQYDSHTNEIQFKKNRFSGESSHTTRF